MHDLRSLGILLFVLLASACGQKGPLVLPDAQKQRSAKPAVPAPAATRGPSPSAASEANDTAADAAPASVPVN
jgi:predicted small lipoprotein YifL